MSSADEATATKTASDGARPAARVVLREGAAVLATMLGVALPFAIGTWLGPRDATVPLEPRYAWVIGAAALAAIAVFASTAAGRARRLALATALVPLTHLLLPNAPWIAALDVVLVLGASATTVLRAVRRVVRAELPRAEKVAFVVALLGLVPGPHFTLGWGLVSTTLMPAATRLFHGSPLIREGERAIEVRSRDGLVIRGTYTPGRMGAPAVLLVHGLADSRRRLVPWAEELASRGAHVLRIDLRAHGVSDGVAVTFADREPDDVIAALRFLAAQPGVGALHVLAVSMGGGASLSAVSRGEPEVESIVALAPATDFRALVERRLPPWPLHDVAAWLVRGVTHGLGHRAPLEIAPVDLVAHAGPLRILVVHSRSDRTIAPEQTERLAEVAPWVEVAWIDGVSHVEMPAHTLSDASLRARIERFLDVPAP